MRAWRSWFRVIKKIGRDIHLRWWRFLFLSVVEKRLFGRNVSFLTNLRVERISLNDRLRWTESWISWSLTLHPAWKFLEPIARSKLALAIVVELLPKTSSPSPDFKLPPLWCSFVIPSHSLRLCFLIFDVRLLSSIKCNNNNRNREISSLVEKKTCDRTKKIRFPRWSTISIF